MKRGDRLWSPVLVGRSEELNRLQEAVRRPPSLVLLEGEAGIGKTRLVRELLRRLDERPDGIARTVLLGAAQPLHQPFPLGPIIEALRHADLPGRLSPLAGALRPFLPELSDRLPPLPEPLEDAKAIRHRAYRAIREVLEVSTPLVLVLEDLHWSDGGTVDFLRFLCADLPPGLSLICTFRGEDLRQESPLLSLGARMPPGAVRLRLSLAPLAPQEVGELIAAILNAHEVSPEFALYLHEKTSGLPFAVEEVIRLLQDRRDVLRRGGRWARRALDQIQVPDAVRDSILERVAALSMPARKVIRAAAVLEAPAEERLVAAVSGLASQDLARGVGDALRSGLLQDQGRLLGFRHLLARQAVYEGIPAPDRRAMHLAAALAVEKRRPRRDRLASLARHYREANRPVQAARAAEAAADLAASLYDFPAACSFLEGALALQDLPPRVRYRLALKYSRAALEGLEHTEAVVVLRRILADTTITQGLRGELRLRLGLLLTQAGDASSGFREIRIASEELRHRPILAIRALKNLGLPGSREGHFQDHLGWLERARELARSHADPALRLAVEVDVAATQLLGGDPGAWRTAAGLDPPGRSMEEDRQLLRGYLNLAQAAVFTGHMARAEEFLGRCRELADRVPYGRLEGAIATTQALIDWSVGRWTGLEERCRPLVEEMADVPLASVDAELVVGSLELSRGGEQPAPGLEATARSALDTGSIPVFEAAAAMAGRALLVQGQALRALEQVEPAVEVVRGKGMWAWAAFPAPVAVEALVALGRLDQAAALAREFEEGLAGRDAPFAQAALLLCRGLVMAGTDQKGAAEAFRTAVAAFRSLPRPLEAALVRERWARALLHDGRPEGPTRAEEALLEFQELGAEHDAARVRRMLREHGVRVAAPWRGGRRGYGEGLSPREREIAELVRSGATNREIAELLFLSARTVETHVANLLRKLGVSSRRDLRSALPSPGGPAEEEALLPA